MAALREIAHADSHMAYHLWVLVFPIVWATLAEKKDQQVQLAKPIIQLLSKEHHSKQMQQRPNVVQVCADSAMCTCGSHLHLTLQIQLVLKVHHDSRARLLYTSSL